MVAHLLLWEGLNSSWQACGTAVIVGRRGRADKQNGACRGPLFADAEAGEDCVQDVVTGPSASHFSQGIERFPQVNGHELLTQTVVQTPLGRSQGLRGARQGFALAGVEQESC